MKRRLRESAGMESVAAYGFGSRSSNFVRRVPQGSFSSSSSSSTRSIRASISVTESCEAGVFVCPRDLIIVNYSGH